MNTLTRKGFVLPTVIFAITIMSIVAVVAVSTATDERRTSRASRESTLAMYAAEAGLRQTYGAWPAGAQTLNPGDSLDLGWQSLPNKASYRVVIPASIKEDFRSTPWSCKDGARTRLPAL